MEFLSREDSQFPVQHIQDTESRLLHDDLDLITGFLSTQQPDANPTQEQLPSSVSTFSPGADKEWRQDSNSNNSPPNQGSNVLKPYSHISNPAPQVTNHQYMTATYSSEMRMGHSSSPDCLPAAKDIDSTSRPQESYMRLIALALLSAPDNQMLLVDIYRYIECEHPYFITAKTSWHNSVRHNLSVNECFVRGKPAPNGRGFYWGIHPASISSFLKGDFTRRVVRGKAQNHTRDLVSPDHELTPVPQKSVRQRAKSNSPVSNLDYEPMSSVPVNLSITLPVKPTKQYRKQNYAMLQAQCALLLGYDSYSRYIS